MTVEEQTLPPFVAGRFLVEGGTSGGGGSGTLSDKVDKDSVVAAATRLVQSKLAGTDAQPAFRIMGDGNIAWGGGGSVAPDLSLYRYGASALGMSAGFAVRHDWGIWTEGSAPGVSNMISHYGAPTDGQPRIRINGTGRIEWGLGGSSATDTYIYRQGVALLHTNAGLITDKAFNVNGSAPDQLSFSSWTSGGANDRFEQQVDGMHWWGDGTNNPDTNLYRESANWLATDDSFWVKGTLYSSGSVEANPLLGTRISGTQVALGIYVTGAAQDSFHSLANGKLEWGPGNAAVDTNLYRSSVGNLVTDGALTVLGNMNVAAGSAFTKGYNTPAWAFYTWKNTGGTSPPFVIGDEGLLNWGSPTGSLDTNLYRYFTDTLATDDNFVSRPGGASAVTIGGVGPGYGMMIGGDTNLYRSAAGVVKTDGVVNAVGGFQVNGVPLAGSSLRASLGATSSASISDWNTAKENGYFMGLDAANAPNAGWCLGFVVLHNTDWVTQEVWAFTSGANPQHYRRQCNGGSWNGWYAVDRQQPYRTTLGLGGGMAHYGSAYGTCRYMVMDNVCVVHGLASLVANCAIGDGIVYGLPTPSGDNTAQIFNQMTNNGPARVDVDGTTLKYMGPWDPLGNGGWISLSGIVYGI